MCPMTYFRSQPIKIDNTKYCLPNILCTSPHALRGSSLLLPVPAAPKMQRCKRIWNAIILIWVNIWKGAAKDKKGKEKGKPTMMMSDMLDDGTPEQPAVGTEASQQPSVFLFHSATFWLSYNPKKGVNECGYTGSWNAPKLPSIFRKCPPCCAGPLLLESLRFTLLV